MGFNLRFAEPDHRPRRRRPKRASGGARLLSVLGLCCAAALAGDLLLSSGRYSNLLIGDAGAAIATGGSNIQALLSGR